MLCRNPAGCVTTVLALLRSARILMLLPKADSEHQAWRWLECLPLGPANPIRPAVEQSPSMEFRPGPKRPHPARAN
ncbi:hypothetical protein C7974DRAFT_214181 [Boeremia exigua]|uniref:uncharacterized protein n=1 Tax=Boeremia exigua TaxID=749465 RepID=UPI001E8DF5C3|nr:uncharacterized protein C7974DRAFT_214181 [Boeremia exigua]KAH6621969.1 hypothetical protein C7974DRAFT_214181 [Boeremia exigua]